LLSGRRGGETGDHRSGLARDAHRAGERGGELLEVGAERAPGDAAHPFQLGQESPHQRGGNGEADVGASTGNGGVHPHHPSLEVEEWAARITGVDRRIGLEELVVGSGAQIAGSGAEDAEGDAGGKPEGIAHGEEPVADPEVLRVSQGGHREIGRWLLHPDKGEVGRSIAADQLGVEPAPVLEHHRDAPGAVDHVVVGDHLAVAVDL
jgi:hypothetical protein